MDALFYFVLGCFVATFIGLVTTTTPKQAMDNLRAWLMFYSGSA
jgi:hypothetical protein